MRVLDASPGELTEAFHLRYTVYRELGYVATADAGLDVDEYDECALPLGVFEVSSQELVGTMRVICVEPRPDYDQAVRCVVVQAGDAALTERVFRRRSAILPSVISPEINQLLVTAAGALPLCELSRLIVRPDCRGSGLSRHLIEAGMALAWQFGPALLVGSCLACHVPMYARYGFHLLRPGAREDYLVGGGQTAHVVVCSPGGVPEPLKSRIEEMLPNIFEGGWYD